MSEAEEEARDGAADRGPEGRIVDVLWPLARLGTEATTSPVLPCTIVGSEWGEVAESGEAFGERGLSMIAAVDEMPETKMEDGFFGQGLSSLLSGWHCVRTTWSLRIAGSGGYGPQRASQIKD